MPIYRTAINVVHPAVLGQAVNIFHIRTTDDIEESTADAVMGALNDFYSALTGSMAGGAVFRWLGEMTTVEAEPVTITPGSPWTVTVPDTDYACPGPTALLVKWSTPTGGRSGRGRTFLNPVGLAGVNTNGKPSAQLLSDVGLAAEALVDWSMGDHGVSLGIWSRKDNLLRDITGSSVLGKFAVITSRRD